jgi:3-oxoacyl-(acyl-carrier-protein) synthase
MTVLALARRLFMIGGIAISVMTRDAWLIVGHVAGAASAVTAAIAFLAFLAGFLRRSAADRPSTLSQDEPIAPHEQGLTGLEPAVDPVGPSAMDGP